MANDFLPLLPDGWNDVPKLKTALPGPKAREYLARDKALISPSYTRSYPLVADRGRGAVVEDVDGNRFLDMTAGIAVCATGHCHPRVVEAVTRQASELIHMSGTDFYYAAQVDLAERLLPHVPIEGPKRIFYTNSGAESVEGAIKLARYHTRRRALVAFFGAFHGRTLGALSLTNSKAVQRSWFGPLIPGVHHAPFPARRPQYGKRPHEGLMGVEYIEKVLFKRLISPDEVAAFVVEPMQGEGGYLLAEPAFYRDLRALADKHGILIVADEVQSGMGRTGTWFASEQVGLKPDIMCVAKGIASGFPLGALVAKRDIMNWPPGAHASTFGGNPVSCAAAGATIGLLEDGLLAHTKRVGERLGNDLRRLAETRPWIGDVRGLGLMQAIEFVKDRDTYVPDSDRVEQVIQSAFERGLLLLPCGTHAIRFAPPLVLTDEQLTRALEIFEVCLGT